MEAKDLRIGNFVDWNGEVGIVSQLLEKDVFFKCGKTDLYDSLKTIPLTEKWLLKFGFEKIYNDYKIQIQENDGGGNSNYWIFVDTGIDNESNEFTIQLVSAEGDWFISKNKYDHQLQNLYFALQQKELTIIIQE